MVNKKVKQEGLEFCYNNDELQCIAIRDSFDSETINYFTPDNFSQKFGNNTLGGWSYEKL